MDIRFARSLIQSQNKSLRSLNGMRFIRGGYEYRLAFHGGFAAYVSVDRRAVGKRNFSDFGFVPVYDCLSANGGFEKVMALLDKKAPVAGNY